MSRWWATLEWVLAILFALMALVGLLPLVTGSLVEGQIGAVEMAVGFLLAAALMFPVFWRRASGPRARLIWYFAAALLVVVTIAILPPAKMVIDLPNAAHSQDH